MLLYKTSKLSFIEINRLTYMLYTSQQKKRYTDCFKIDLYVKTKTIVYYQLRQCLRETRLS